MKENEKTGRKLPIIQNEEKFYFILQLIFAAAQVGLMYVAIWAENFRRSGILVFVIFGILMLLLAGKCWQSRTARIVGRALMALSATIILLFAVVDVCSTRVFESVGGGYTARPFADYAGQFLAYLCLYGQAVLLVTFPTFVMAARRQKNPLDIRILKILSVLLPLLAIATWALSFEAQTRLDFSAALLDTVSNNVLLILYIFCTVASLLIVWEVYSDAMRKLKERIDRKRSKK